MPLPWPFGRVHVAKETGPPSDAYLKFKEILLHARLDEPSAWHGQHVIELGSHPGGWTWVLLELGAERIDTVDWAAMDHPSIAAHPNASRLHHHQMDAKTFSVTIEAPDNRGHVLVSDAAIPPPLSLALLDDWLSARKGPAPRRVMWALKFAFRADTQQSGDDEQPSHRERTPLSEKERSLQAVAMAETLMASHSERYEWSLRQLYHHGNEAVLLAVRKDE